MSQLEILAPAGNMEMLTAAARSGADAVYLGLGNFNARRTANGFFGEQLAEAVRFCHARGVRVHGAVNTTVYAPELPALAQTITDAAQAGVDALIVQDLAAARLAQQIAPEVELHGSTQMSVHTLQGALQLADMGFDRVILSRELSLDEIRAITEACPIETEVFVHGALCMCVSGQCYMSAFLGGRSGNRGSCAGTCRLPFQADALPAGKPAQTYHLSLKDMDVIDALPALQKAGVASVKIEGRLRTPEYVAAAVAACRGARDGAAYDRALLQDVFSRSGFTAGYLQGKRDGSMFGVRTGEDAAKTREALPRARELFRREFPAVAVDMSFYCDEEGASLTVSDGVRRVYSFSDEKPQPARTDPAEALRRSLAKTGGTPFYAHDIEIEMEGGPWFLPGSTVNELRRDSLEKLLLLREKTPERMIHSVQLHDTRRTVPSHKLAARFESWEQFPRQAAEQLWRIVLPIAEAEKVPQPLREKTVLELPRVLFGNLEQQTAQRIQATRSLGFAGYEFSNIAGVRLCAGLPMFGGFGLNITNPIAAEEYKQLGLAQITLLPELTLEQMAAIDPGIPTAMIVYGHMPLMITRACPMQNVTDCKHCSKKGVLTDRKAAKFPVRCGLGVRTIYNPVPIYMGDKQEQIPADVLTAYFTVETREQAAAILAQISAGKPFDGDFTRGLYYKGTN